MKALMTVFERVLRVTWLNVDCAFCCCRNPGLVLLATLLVMPPAFAEERDHIYLDETVISGNQELPRVLYILPWRNEPGEPPRALPPPVGQDSLMQPIFPQEYQREIALRELVSQPGSVTPTKE